MKVIPNILSVFRICLVPVFIIVYFTDDRDIKYYAILVFAIAGLSDFLDGYIARKYDAQSKLGKLLDPLGDKLMTFSVLICITITKPMFLWAVLVFFIKEVLMGVGGLILHKKARVELPPANMIGKASTVVFFLVCITLMLFSNMFGNTIPDYVAVIMISAAIGLTLIALAVYLKSYIKIMKAISKEKQNILDVN